MWRGTTSDSRSHAQSALYEAGNRTSRSAVPECGTWPDMKEGQAPGRVGNRRQLLNMISHALGVNALSMHVRRQEARERCSDSSSAHRSMRNWSRRAVDVALGSG